MKGEINSDRSMYHYVTDNRLREIEGMKKRIKELE